MANMRFGAIPPNLYLFMTVHAGKCHHFPENSSDLRLEPYQYHALVREYLKTNIPKNEILSASDKTKTGS
jgi:hypothetical protein